MRGTCLGDTRVPRAVQPCIVSRAASMSGGLPRGGSARSNEVRAYRSAERGLDLRRDNNDRTTLRYPHLACLRISPDESNSVKCLLSSIRTSWTVRSQSRLWHSNLHCLFRMQTHDQGLHFSLTSLPAQWVISQSEWLQSESSHERVCSWSSVRHTSPATCYRSS